MQKDGIGFSRKGRLGSLPNKKPNRFRPGQWKHKPLQYPPEADTPERKLQYFRWWAHRTRDYHRALFKQAQENRNAVS